MLQEFSGLANLPKIQEHPIKHSGNSTEIDSNKFAETLQEIYENPDETMYVDYEEIKNVPLFILLEFHYA